MPPCPPKRLDQITLSPAASLQGADSLCLVSQRYFHLETLNHMSLLPVSPAPWITRRGAWEPSSLRLCISHYQNLQVLKFLWENCHYPKNGPWDNVMSFRVLCLAHRSVSCASFLTTLSPFPVSCGWELGTELITARGTGSPRRLQISGKDNLPFLLQEIRGLTD